ncbi:30S ribosomal protein S3 [Candidatus Uhrbacteria bacterium RIFCSPLOWO2_01_FULL_47_24]|uniref:Small ribosomal subunit protein uS3 n=1 Tax=Candidatus Uhrbacteria bacterium RIFCSPLOWO2_01_FULL_47_24 TaxID=1802401 RepID=A0A1F7UTR8_9BACT|nr:MAG: 30S ribosomal protein S3 [Candidatus Uhrbacteria bacterium RIFCSPHIGHO2_01_FULL_47_11]OGL68974.1 MAG: 30S ribosomal protein S3 [Candidatus Uhrbacteria bacterium RIFCSPHIGHO2_02_FULL_46_47]OGL74909.1 MAG: 30S ribosomal protein S3 [Candidatus Uhrbacteria bacterium RIFCSPHIGHO2_12_FULL_47_11]OGL81649.1 MAG: 30S ribosomal protein S3 [Candidatus Uhrbacteria bacterium RIFCSPLOWO2_01_FULL_47_24]OGL85098.1 MAG: 30S ribosomal protein S3 [Candidatus Uhrbacteria bacterium RIFCSPLOWO2_02_FULL_46_25
MGQKVHPLAFRLAGIYTWPSKWFMRKGAFRENLRQDIMIRDFIVGKLKGAGVTRVEIERPSIGATITIFAAKPGVIIGRGGAQIEELKKQLKAKFKLTKSVTINIQEIDKPSLHGAVIAEGVKLDLEKRIPFRTVVKQALERSNKAGALGAKITVSGRLNGSEIARDETLSFGSIPLQNLRADIDYALDEAHTIYGKIGIKVWVYRGEIFSAGGGSALGGNK